MTHSDDGEWRSRVIRRSGRPIIDWFFLGTLGSPEISIGVLRDGSWVVDTADGLADLQDTRALTFVFPILKLSATDVRKRITEFKQKPETVLCSSFPLNRLIISAIFTGGYWAKLAFRWLSEVELNPGERREVVEGLMSIESEKDFDQKLRQEAVRLRRSFESSI